MRISSPAQSSGEGSVMPGSCAAPRVSAVPESLRPPPSAPARRSDRARAGAGPFSSARSALQKAQPTDTATLCGFASSLFGSSMLSTPFLYVARIFSDWIGNGSVRLRWNLPEQRSER